MREHKEPTRYVGTSGLVYEGWPARFLLPSKKEGTMQRLEVKTSISAPIITEAMKLALLLSIAKQLGVCTHERPVIGSTSDDVVISH